MIGMKSITPRPRPLVGAARIDGAKDRASSKLFLQGACATQSPFEVATFLNSRRSQDQSAAGHSAISRCHLASKKKEKKKKERKEKKKKKVRVFNEA